MVSAKKWRERRKPTFKAPSGDIYKIERPDPLSLIKFWITECGLESPIDQEDLGKTIMRDPEIIRKMLCRYILEPKVTMDGSGDSLSVEEIASDQMDALAILTEVMSPLIHGADELLDFFRKYFLIKDGRRTLPNGSRTPH